MSRRIAAVLLMAGALVLAFGGAAWAHVTVHPATAAPGSFQELTFQAPNESANAEFVKLVVHLPSDHPLASLSARALDGWSISTAKAKLPKPITTDDGTATEYTSQVTWTADSGSGIGPGQYQDFDVSAGPLPASGSLVFTVDQFYSDGTVVHWDQPSPAGKPEPEHPAPVLAVSDPAPSNASDGLARGIGAAGLGVGLVALIGGIFIARRPGGQEP
jgi:periplasmic copper chaperone A